MMAPAPAPAHAIRRGILDARGAKLHVTDGRLGNFLFYATPHSRKEHRLYHRAFMREYYGISQAAITPPPGTNH